MSDKPKGVVFQGAGSPNASGQQPEPGSMTPQPEFVTREEALKLAQEAGEEAYRKAQSLYDKGSQKVQAAMKSLEEVIALQKTMGIAITPEQQAQLVALRTQQALTSGNEAPVSAPATEQPRAPQPTAQRQPGAQEDPWTLKAWQIMEAAGVYIEDSDEEAKLIKMEDPYEFLKSLEQVAIPKKRERLAQAAPRTPTTAGGAGTPTSLEMQYRQEVNRATGREERLMIRAKYRKQGLNI